MNIAVYDPAYVYNDDLCGTNMPSATTVPTLAQVIAAYPGIPMQRATVLAGQEQLLLR